MTVHVVSVTFPYNVFGVSAYTTEIIDLLYGDTVSATLEQDGYNLATQEAWLAANPFVFSLVNCSVSPLPRYNGETFVITPTTYGIPYSCRAVLTHQTNTIGTTQTKTLTVRGGSVAQFPTSNGLKTFDAAGSITLDTDYRCVRFAGFLSGNVTYGTPVTLNVTGLVNDGTWGYNNNSEESWSVQTTLNSGSITVEAVATGTHSYNIQLFRD